jgi:hypothetical protein
VTPAPTCTTGAAPITDSPAGTGATHAGAVTARACSSHRVGACSGSICGQQRGGTGQVSYSSVVRGAAGSWSSRDCR